MELVHLIRDYGQLLVDVGASELELEACRSYPVDVQDTLHVRAASDVLPRDLHDCYDEEVGVLIRVSRDCGDLPLDLAQVVLVLWPE